MDRGAGGSTRIPVSRLKPCLRLGKEGRSPVYGPPRFRHRPAGLHVSCSALNARLAEASSALPVESAASLEASLATRD